jgi:hypothetical protein
MTETKLNFKLSIKESDKYYASFCEEITSAVTKFAELGCQVQNFKCEGENHEFGVIQQNLISHIEKFITFYSEAVLLLECLVNNKENFDNKTLFGKLIEMMSNGGEILVHPMASFQGVEKSIRETFFNRFNLNKSILGSCFSVNTIEEK